MTVTLNSPYATFGAGATVDLDNATEAALVAQGRAAYTFNPGGTFLPLTAAEQQLVRDGQASWGGQVYTWANRPSAVTAGVGAEIVVTDIGSNGYTRWRSDGSLWRLVNPSDILFDVTPITGLANASEQILKQYTLPAGLLTSLRYFSIKVLSAKSSTAETATLRFRLGTAGTTADTQTATSAGLSGANRVFSSETMMFASSAVQLRALTATFTAGFAATTSGNAYPQNTAVTDMSANSLILSISEQMSVGAEQATIAHVILTGY